MVAGLRVHLVAAHLVEPFRCLPVALSNLRTKFAGPVADRVRLDVIKAAVVALFPHLELGFFLKNANEDRLVSPHTLLAEEHHGLTRQRAKMRWDLGRGAGSKMQGRAHNRAYVKAWPHASLHVHQVARRARGAHPDHFWFDPVKDKLTAGEAQRVGMPRQTSPAVTLRTTLARRGPTATSLPGLTKGVAQSP